MHRHDTTSEDYQRSWRGQHQPSNGVWSYPIGDGRRGTRYLRCGCGWRLVGIYDKPGGAQMRKATGLFAEHRRQMAAVDA